MKSARQDSKCKWKNFSNDSTGGTGKMLANRPQKKVNLKMRYHRFGCGSHRCFFPCDSFRIPTFAIHFERECDQISWIINKSSAFCLLIAWRRATSKRIFFLAKIIQAESFVLVGSFDTFGLSLASGRPYFSSQLARNWSTFSAYNIQSWILHESFSET